MAKKFETFGKFILLEKLAAGGMAEVYLAKSTGASGIDKFVAIKRILPQFSDNPDFIDMFKDEAKIAVNLKHSNIVSIYEFGIESDQLFLVMEYVEGRNLRQLLNQIKKKKTSLSIDQIVFLIKEVAAGLDYAHRCLDDASGRPLNITHRDMSPQNIMISFEGEAKIVDFGIAKAESQLETTRAGTLKGKFGYMSPEQAEGSSIDLRTDIFSLGIVLWELLGKDRLFASNNEVNTLRKVRECQIPSLRKADPNIPQELERICFKALTKDRNLRYQTASTLYRDLNRFLNVHYPDFSSQDFSVFIKTLYSDMVIDNRKKLVEYAKATAQTSQDNEKTVVIPDSSAKKPKKRKKKDEVLKINLEKNHNVNLSALKTKETDRDLKRRILKDKTNPFTSDTSLSKTSVTRVTSTRTNLKKIKSGSSSNSLYTIIGVTALVAAIFIFAKDHVTRLLKREVSNPIQQTNTTNPWQETELASKAKREVSNKHSLIVKSDPSGAEIFINSISTKILTPGQVKVESQKPFTLTLKKDGYINYEKRFRVQKNSSLQATLLKTSIGYIDINIFNGGPSTRIFINDKQIREPLPIKKYAVPANSTLVIRAENPFSRAQAQKRIKVKQDTRLKVDLILKVKKKRAKGKQRRKVSGRKR